MYVYIKKVVESTGETNRARQSRAIEEGAGDDAVDVCGVS